LLDRVKIIFYGEHNWVDKKTNAPVNGGPDPDEGNVLIAELPPQKEENPPPAEINAAAALAGDIG